MRGMLFYPYVHRWKWALFSVSCKEWAQSLNDVWRKGASKNRRLRVVKNCRRYPTESFGHKVVTLQQKKSHCQAAKQKRRMRVQRLRRKLSGNGKAFNTKG